VLTSDAFVVTPGGIGTVLELMMIWQLLQVRQMKESPLILVGKMWEGLVEWTRDQLLTTQPPLISPEDVDIPQCVGTADDAIALLKQHHAQWMREHAGDAGRGS
jgi:predicted Rossmann-fold nucleotide-binding protein